MYDLNQIPYDYTVVMKSRFKGLDLIEYKLNKQSDNIQQFKLGNKKHQNKCLFYKTNILKFSCKCFTKNKGMANNGNI